MNEKARRIITSTLYSALFILIPIVTIALVGLAQGYRLDLQTGQVVTGGLVQLSSQPRGAHITIDGEYIGETTPERLVLSAGEYDVVLDQDGFRRWQKVINVLPSEVTWVQYPFLLPNSIRTETYNTFKSLKQFTKSPDEKFIAITSQDDNGPKVEILETNDPGTEPKLAYRLPSSLRGKANINHFQWANDSEHILIELKLEKSTRQILVDAIGDDEAINITDELRLPVSGLKFDQKNWRELYWLSPEGLRRLDMGANTVSAVLADGVIDYIVTEEGVFMIRRTDDRLGLYQLGRDNELVAIKDDFDAGHKLGGIEYLDFDRTKYLALINNTQQQITLVSGVTTGNITSRDISFAAEELMASPNGRYLLARKGGEFTAFDVDLDNLHRFELDQGHISQLSWYGNSHLLATADGSVVIFEFDGANQEPIVDGVDGFIPYGSEDGKLVYSVGRSSVSNNLIVHVSTVVE